jgi:hypothetical protein
MWMNPPIELALTPQKPSHAGVLRVVAADTKQDGIRLQATLTPRFRSSSMRRPFR